MVGAVTVSAQRNKEACVIPETVPSSGSGPGDGSERLGLALLVCALGFNAILLAPELSVGRVPLTGPPKFLTAARGTPYRLGRNGGNR